MTVVLSLREEDEEKCVLCTVGGVSAIPCVMNTDGGGRGCELGEERKSIPIDLQGRRKSSSNSREQQTFDPRGAK